MIEPHIAAWALERLKRDKRFNAEFHACQLRLEKLYPKMPERERVLRAEPISVSIGLTELLAGTFLAGYGGTIVTAALGIGFSLIARAIAPKSQVPTHDESPSNGPESRYSTRQPVPPQRIIIGTAQVGYALAFEQVKPPNLFHLGLICARQVTAFRRMWIGTTEIIFRDFNEGSILTPIAPLTPNYPGRLQLSVRRGSTTQAMDTLITTNFPSMDGQFRQRGIATVALKFGFGADQDEYSELWGQVSQPTALFLVDGVALPNPRNPAHIINWDPSDPASVAAAEATWEFTNNAALAQAWYLTQRFGGRILPSKIDWDKVADAANYDDEVVGCKDGTLIKRHTIDGVITLDQQPFNTMQDMLTANRGFVLESGGRVWVSSSRPRVPVVTIHDGILTGAFQFQATRAKRDLINMVKSRFVASEREYQIVDGPTLSRTDLQAADGELLEGTLSFPFSMDHRRVQRLQKASLDSNRIGRTVTCQVDVSVLADADDELVGSAVVMSSALFPQADGTYFVTSVAFAQSYSVLELQLVEYDGTIESDWQPAVDEQDFVLADLDVT